MDCQAAVPFCEHSGWLFSLFYVRLGWVLFYLFIAFRVLGVLFYYSLRVLSIVDCWSLPPTFWCLFVKADEWHFKRLYPMYPKMVLRKKKPLCLLPNV